MQMTVYVSLFDVLEAISLNEPPADCQYELGQNIEFTVYVDEDDAEEALIKEGYVVSRLDDTREQLPLHELKDALNALKSGEYFMARTLLSRMLDDQEARVVDDVLIGQEPLPLPQVGA